MKLLEFDTREKKPKLYALIALTAVALAVVSVLIAVDRDGCAGAVAVFAAAYCFFSVLILLYSFREQIRYNPYSYNTIFYFGFSVFAFFVMITFIVLSVRIFRSPGVYPTDAIVGILLSSAKNYTVLTLPFLLVFSVALCVSNVSLIRHEGKRPVNLLGIVLSVLIIGGEVFILTFDFYVSGSQTEVMIHDIVANVSSAIFLYFECMLIGTIVADAIAAKHEPTYGRGFIIILGCGLKKDGAPSPLLRGRIERALEFSKKQEEATGQTAIFVASGGRGPNEPVSEAAAIKRYLIERGVPEERIVEEDLSTDTYENMKFSKEKIDAIDPSASVAFSTTNYHVFRGGVFARRVKMRAVGMGAKTKWYFWPNAAVREFVGLLTKHVVKQAVILGAMIAFYVAITVIAYSV